MKLERTRYICFAAFGGDPRSDLFSGLVRIFRNMFGDIALGDAKIRKVLEEDGIFVVKVNEKYAKALLFSSCFADLTSIFTTGTIKKAKEKIEKFLSGVQSNSS